MLINLFEEVHRLGAEAFEIEYKDGKEWVTAFRGSVGIGIASFSCQEAEPLFAEFKALKRKKVITIAGIEHRVRFREYESFGERVYRVEFIS